MSNRFIEGGWLQASLRLLPVFLASLGMFSLQWGEAPGNGLGKIFGDVTLTAADRVLAGDVPYRDFWTMYAPGSYYLLAMLFSLFGHHVTVGSVAASLLCAGAITLCFLLVDRLSGNRVVAFVCAAIFFAAFYATGYYLSLGPYPPVIFCVFVALNLIAQYHRSGKLSYLFTAGLAVGLAIVFKHDVGGYTGIAVTAGIVAGYFLVNPGSAGTFSGLVGRVLLFSVGAALIFLPVMAYFALLAGYDMWYDLIVFPATDFKYARGEHYPGLWPGDFSHDWWLGSVFRFLGYLQFTLTFALFWLAVITLVVTARSGRREYLPLTVTLFVLILFHYVSAHVQINTNIISMPAYAAILGGISYLQIAGMRRGGGGLVIGGIALTIGIVMCLSFLTQPLYRQFRGTPPEVEMTLPKVRGIRVSAAMNDVLTGLAAYFDEHVPPGNRIFIGLHRHDTTVVGDGKMYFILDRLNATRHDQLHPGIVDTAKIQREMIHDLQEHDVRHIIIKHVFSDDELDELRAAWEVTLPNSGATELDEYLRSNYTKVRTVGRYEIHVRQDQLSGLLPPMSTGDWSPAE